jgi:hypothetical protein
VDQKATEQRPRDDDRVTCKPFSPEACRPERLRLELLELWGRQGIFRSWKYPLKRAKGYNYRRAQKSLGESCSTILVSTRGS